MKRKYKEGEPIPKFKCRACGVTFHWSDVGFFDDEDNYVIFEDDDPNDLFCDRCAIKEMEKPTS
jgi:hypothetical protein